MTGIIIPEYLPIQKGERYNILPPFAAMACERVAECDGILVLPMGIVCPDARAAGILNQMGRFKCKHRGGK